MKGKIAQENLQYIADSIRDDLLALRYSTVLITGYACLLYTSDAADD